MPKDESHLNRSSVAAAAGSADGSSTAAGPSGGGDDDSANTKAPLKRGDACLYCRKRRIRCSAHKPTCDHCKKLGRECVYDTGKPVSRVKQLEDKVAELQEMLLKQHGTPAPIGQGQPIGQDQAGPQTTDRQGSGEKTGAGAEVRPPLQPMSQAASSDSSDGFSRGTAFSYTGGVPPPRSGPGVGNSNTGIGQGVGPGPASGLNSTNPFNFGYMKGMAVSGSTSTGPSLSNNATGLNTHDRRPNDTMGSTGQINASNPSVYRSADLADSQMYHGRGVDLSSANNPYSFASSGSEFPVNMSAMAETPRPQSFDFGTLDPSFMNLVSQFSAASTSDPQHAQSGTGLQGQVGPGTGPGPGQGQEVDMDYSMMMAMSSHGTGMQDGGMPSPQTMAMMDTPALMDAFTRANDGFFDASTGLTPAAGSASGGQAQRHGQSANQASSSVQALFATPSQGNSGTGIGVSVSNTPHRGSDSGMSGAGSGSGTAAQGRSPYSVPSNGSNASYTANAATRDPRAASVSEFDEPSMPPSGAMADAQLKTVGVHLPGQDLVNGSSPIWRRDPMNIQQTNNTYGGSSSSINNNNINSNNNRSSFSVSVPEGVTRSVADMQREQVRANAATYAEQSGWKTGYGYQSGTSKAMGSATVNDAWKRDPNMDGLPLVGGWFDAADLPAVARDHLLDIFFSKAKVFGQEFHVPRFYASLSLPPSRRPHPCLLYSMYTMAARSSAEASIRSLESHFYSIALRQLEEAVARCDRILDATRAAAMLAVYKYGLAKYHEGYMMTGMAARLGMSAGLHQISSSIWQPPKYPTDRRADLGSLMRQRSYILGPPADAIELGERIWAFWSIYVVDRCGAIAAEWPPAIPDNIVTTPYPKPLYEYELNLVTERDNISLSSLWSGAPIVSDPYAFSNGIMMHIRALAILEVSSKLMYLPPEPGWEANIPSSAPGTAGGSPAAMAQQQQQQQPQYQGQLPGQTIDDFLRAQNFAAAAYGNGMRAGFGGAGGGFGGGGGGDMGGMSSMSRGSMGGGGFDMMDMDDPSSYMPPGFSSTGSPANGNPKSRSWTRTARIRTPKAYEEVHMALRRLEADLPPERRTNWEVWDGVCNVPVDAGAKRGGIALHFCIGCAWMFMWDVYAFTAENTLAVNVARRMAATVGVVLQKNAFDDLDTFIPMTWSFTIKILIREAKRLKAIDRSAEAAPLESDIETILKALQVFGQRYNLASMQAMQNDRYHKSTDADTAHLAADDDEEGDELFVQSSRQERVESFV